MYNIRKRESQRLAAPEPSSPAALARAASRRFYNQNFVQKFFRKYHVFEKIQYFLFDLAALPTVTVFILLVELIVNLVIIYYVPYTEIDWKAYMQECEGFLNGTTNYALLKGDTGPLVYPAAFVYIYSALYFITSQGENIRLAQYIFALIYLLQMWLVLRLYTKSCKVPPYVLIFCSFTARRIHSIYVLRLFNDPIAILFLYAALNFFADYKFTWGSIFFSLGVACKMNILLFAPALFLFYLMNLGVFKTIKQLAICGILQLLLGLPFLLTYPWQYIKGSFDLGRIFEHKWTVNYRFLPREYFEHTYFHLALLVVHLALLSVFAQPTIKYFKTFRILKYVQHQIMPQLEEEKKRIEENKTKEENKRKHKKGKKSDTSEEEQEDEKQVLSKEEREFLRVFEENLKKSTGFKTPSKQLEQTEEEADDIYSVNYSQSIQLVLLPFFLCNFIGVVCARSLHYQFYVWYFHSLPYLAWSAHYGVIVRFALLGLIEFCWNIYPSTNFSSFVLHICHLVLLYSVGRNIFITINLSNAENK